MTAARAGSHEPEATSFLASERWTVGAAVVGAALVFWLPAFDSHGAFKAGLVAVAAVVLLGLGAVRALGEREVRVPGGLPGTAAALLALAFVVTATASDNAWRSWIGQTGRYDGAALYLLLLLIFALLARRASIGDSGFLAITIAVTGAAVAGYGILQRLGIDPVDHRSPYGALAAVSTLGNPNFVSAFLAVALPLALWWLLSTKPPARYAALVACGLLVLGIFVTRSFQGVIAGSMGSGFVLIDTARERPGSLRRWLLAALAAIAVAAITIISVGLSGGGPLGSTLDDAGRSQRLEFWGAGARMFGDHPLLGIGPDRFGEYYRSYRTHEGAIAAGVRETADEPHNVPLGMFVGGGLVLGLAYLAFVLSTGLVLLRGLRSSKGGGHQLLVGLGGAWIAYQAQSVVSIDVPPLALLHYVLAGAILAVAGAPTRAVLTWARSGRGRGRRRGPVPVPQWQPVAVLVVTLAFIWVVSAPLRAEVFSARAYIALRSGHPDRAVTEMRRAHEMLAYEPRYHAEVARMYLAADEPTESLRWYAAAVGREPRNVPYVQTYARLLDASGQLDEAERWYQHALELEPNATELKTELGRFELRRGRNAEAERLARLVLVDRPDDTETLLVLADALRVQGDVAAARTTYKRVLVARSSDTNLRLALASVYSKAGDHGAAIELLREAIAMLDSQAEWWYRLGSELEQVGDRDEAVTSYLRAVELQHQYPEAAAALRRLGVPGYADGPSE